MATERIISPKETHLSNAPSQKPSVLLPQSKKTQTFNKIHVLASFNPYLRLITAYNRKHFRHSCWRHHLRSGIYALCTLVLNVIEPIIVVLGIWYLIEIDADLARFTVSTPLVISLLQNELTFCALQAKSPDFEKTIDQLQAVISRRE